jgi:hypothetical protein
VLRQRRPPESILVASCLFLGIQLLHFGPER